MAKNEIMMLRLEATEKRLLERVARQARVKASVWVREAALRAAKETLQVQEK